MVRFWLLVVFSWGEGVSFFLSSFLPFFLSSFLPFFLSSFLPFAFQSVRPRVRSFIHACVRAGGRAGGFVLRACGRAGGRVCAACVRAGAACVCTFVFCMYARTHARVKISRVRFQDFNISTFQHSSFPNELQASKQASKPGIGGTWGQHTTQRRRPPKT